MYAKKVVEKKTKHIEVTHQILSLNTTYVDREVKMTNGEEKEVIAEKNNALEQTRVNENMVKIDRVMESCVLFTKVQWGEDIDPHHLYLELMEFLVNKRKTKDDVLYVSFFPL